MKRNWYAVVILLMLCLLLLAAGRYVDRTTEALVQQVQAAYALAMQGDCPAARRAYGRAAEKARESSGLLNLLVRRNILDQMNQTMAVLPPCAETDSLADLEMETQRACTQIKQVRQSFFGGL
ncbi:MAG: DUF4363 family protein [Oscillospiraceae bacterium]|nr:MAG: DUF4363 family protein [Oscillospiraceae bacterium]